MPCCAVQLVHTVCICYIIVEVLYAQLSIHHYEQNIQRGSEPMTDRILLNEAVSKRGRRQAAIIYRVGQKFTLHTISALSVNVSTHIYFIPSQ